MVVENESSSGVTGWPLESEEDDRGRTGVRGDEVVLAAPGVAVRPPIRTPSWAHLLELVVPELAGPPDEADGPIPRLLSAVWRRSARPPVPGCPCEVLIMVEEAEPVGGAARVSAHGHPFTHSVPLATPTD